MEVGKKYNIHCYGCYYIVKIDRIVPDAIIGFYNFKSQPVEGKFVFREMKSFSEYEDIRELHEIKEGEIFTFPGDSNPDIKYKSLCMHCHHDYEQIAVTNIDMKTVLFSPQFTKVKVW